MNKKHALIPLLFMVFWLPINAQIDYDKVPEVTNTILINDVHIQKSPASNFGIGDILMKDGLIVQISKNIDPPFDARVIEADSAYAYPAFIDALSHTGMSKKENKEERPKIKFKGYPPNDVAGITPERSAKDFIGVKESSLKDMREAGFGIVHAVPRGKMLPGQGCLFSLSGDTPESMLLQENVSQFFQFKGSRPVFPSTTIAVMAKWRDLCRQSGYLLKHRDTYKQSSIGTQRPKSDKSLEALFPIVDKKAPVFMNTPKVKDVFRALVLKKELGYNLVLSDVKQIMPALNKVKASGASILLSTALPKEAKKDKKKKDKKDKPDKEKDDKEKSDKKKENEFDMEAKLMKERKEASMKAYVGLAGELEKQGINFGFSMLSGKPKDLQKNLMRMIEAGLSEKAALAALTTGPAKILNIDNKVGTIDKGKLANIFISDKPYFEKDSKIKFVFVEGKVTELKKDKKKKKSSGDGNLEPLIGVWSYEVQIPGETQSGEITISNDGELAIELVDESTPDETDKATDIDTDGTNVTFVLTINDDGMDIKLDFDLDFTEDGFEGMVQAGPFGSFPISGSKISSPE